MGRVAAVLVLAAACGAWVLSTHDGCAHHAQDPIGAVGSSPAAGLEEGGSAAVAGSPHAEPLRSTPHLQIAVLPRSKRLGDLGQVLPPATPSGAGPTSRLLRLSVRRSREALDSGWELRVCGLPVPSLHAETVVEIAMPRAGEFVVVGALETKQEPHETLFTECLVRVVDDPADGDMIRSLSSRVLTPNGAPNRLVVRKLGDLRDLRAVPALWQAIDSPLGREGAARASAIHALGRICHVSSLPRLIRLFPEDSVGGRAWGAVVGSLGGSFPPFTRPPGGRKSITEESVAAGLAWYRANEGRLRSGLHQLRP